MYGNHTLTHFYSLHVGILPPLLIVLLVAHVAIFRRHGITAPAGAQARGVGLFWPDQAFRDIVVCLLVFGVMLGLVILGGHGTKLDNGEAPAGLYERWAKAGQTGWGANLDAPADPLTEGYPARPEWYFLFLFQLLKYFEGDQFLVGAVVIPNAVAVLLFLLPLFGIGRMRKFGHVVGVIVVVALLCGVGLLTVLAIADDSPAAFPLGLGGGTDKAKDLHHKFAEAEEQAHRAVVLAAHGIPEEGARYLLRNDPASQGPKLFKQHCAVCHAYAGLNDGNAKHKASDLSGFGTEAWVRGLLTNPGDPKYFGHTKLEGMKNWRAKVNKSRDKWRKTDGAVQADKKIAEQDADFATIAKWLAAQAKPKSRRDTTLDKRGRELFDDNCASCHAFGGDADKNAPDLANYASASWVRGMIMDPASPSLHGKNNEMTEFRELSGPAGDLLLKEFLDMHKKNDTKVNVADLSAVDRELIIRWLTHDDRVVFGGKGVVP